jgi:anaerobic ribonucleoside-triphosphate reductase
MSNLAEQQHLAAPTLLDSERTRCEVWTRVMGYHRPVQAFNIGKQGEFAERICFDEARTR